MNNHRFEAERLLGLGLLPIPGSDKAPAGCRHKNGKWSRAIAMINLKKFEKCASLCILLDSTLDDPNIITNLIVFDFDDQTSYDYMRAKFPVIDTAPLVQTTHGFHVYFQRTQLVEDLGISDCARALKIRLPEDDGLPFDDKHKLLIDIKTRTSVMNENGLYTASVLSVPPSKGKKWIRAFPETPLLPLPDALADWIAARRVSGKRPRTHADQPSAAKKRSALSSVRDRIEPNISALRRMGFREPMQTAAFDTVSEMSAQHGYCLGAQFIDPRVQDGSPCPVCSKSDGHRSNN